MDIKKSGGPPLPQPESLLAIDKSGALPRPAISPSAAQPLWQSGQILQALVLKTTPEQILLNIQGLQASVARPPRLNLQVGDRLQLEVLKNTSPPPQLKLLERQPATGTVINRALRTSLPQQQTLPPLLANIEYLSRHPAGAHLLDRAVRNAAQQLYYQLPSQQSLRQPQALKQALELSGPFLEHHLHTPQQAPALNLQQDLRLNLLRLATQLQHYIARETDQPQSATSADARRAQPGSAPPPPPFHSSNPTTQPAVAANLTANKTAEQLLQQTEGVLARLHIHQLHHLKSEEAGRPAWSMELPVRSEQGINLFDIRIHKESPFPNPWNEEDEQHKQPQAEPRWSVRLAFDLEGLGPVQAVIALQQERLSVHFHAQENQTSVLFNKHMDMLSSRLRQAGLDVATIDCRQGQAEPAAEISGSPILDEQA
ncbi:hypothetical protein MNBD_GAMMA24-1779 [hydrothermal vent metagenome]|uniref:Flagellar hook-length control protein-like C-terminal domain-containing protein n=1 Tax=hydrothermal vent metagenome TaxID=652676 RepID=A0A3B1B378_9ZZZZ